MIFAMPNKPGEFSRFDFPDVLPAPLNGKFDVFILVKRRFFFHDPKRCNCTWYFRNFCYIEEQ